MPYTITEYTLQKAKQMKVTVQLSQQKNKKIDVLKNGVRIATIGDSRYKDFPLLSVVVMLERGGSIFSKKKDRHR